MTHDEIRVLLARTTPGAWYDHGDAVSTNPESGGVGYPPAHYAICSLNDGEYIENTNKKDAAFIAASKSIVKQLLEENEELRSVLSLCKCGISKMLTCEHGNWYFDGTTKMIDGKPVLTDIKICGKCGKNFILN